jgi:DNA-binding MarR family transcriptional regulator
MDYVEDALLLFSQAGQRATRAIEQAVKVESVTGNVATTALLLLHRDGPQRPTLIAGECGLTSGGATKLLTRLEKNGLIDRHSNVVPDDGRAVLVTLTPYGHRTVEAMLEAVEDTIRDLIDALITVREEGPTT